MSCENCDCWECREERDNASQLAEIQQRLKGWNWNAHPIEIAKELNKEVDQYYVDNVLDELEKFFSKEQRDAVEEAMDYV